MTKLGVCDFTVTNTLAYYDSKLITTVKCFIYQTPDDKAWCKWLTVANPLAYYNSKLITAAKFSISQAPNDKTYVWTCCKALPYFSRNHRQKDNRHFCYRSTNC